MITQAFRDQSLDDILATRSKAVVLASDTSGGALESLSSATFVASKVRDAASMYFKVTPSTPRRRRRVSRQYLYNTGGG